MIIGINYPWINYGWDFGDPPSTWVADETLTEWREAKRERIEADFKLFAAQGISAVRLFLLGDGLSYGISEFAPRQIDKRWSFAPLPQDHRFHESLCRDFECILQTCARNDLKLFPSLIDFHWCRLGIPVSDNRSIIKCGRYDILQDPIKRQMFFDSVLDPLLAISMRYQDSIYAWELINEPEWAVYRKYHNEKRDEYQNIEQREMMEFIADGIKRINGKRLPDGRSAFQSSVGFAHWDTHDKWDAETLGITLKQFHYYAQGNQELPRNRHTNGCSCIIGEFATAAGCEWPDLKAGNRDQTTANRLCCIRDKGYSACFLWSARAQDSSTRWTEEVQKDVLAFTSSNQPADPIV